MNLSIQSLTVSQITPALFAGFVRRQQVKRCWRKESGRWVLKDIAFLDDWSPADYTHLLQKLRAILLSGGAVLAAFDGKILAGFAAVTNEPFGPAEEYLQLSELNVSQPLRGQGIGRELFRLACEQARIRGAQKLYLSAHSAEETQAFYRAMGCVEAAWYHPELVALEPLRLPDGISALSCRKNFQPQKQTDLPL